MSALSRQHITVASCRGTLGIVISALLVAGCDQLQVPSVDDEPEPVPQAGSPPPVVVTPVVVRTPEQIIDEFLAATPSLRTNEQLRELSELDEGLDRITELDLSQSVVSDDGVAVLVKFVALTKLDLSGSRATSAVAQHLVGVTGLEELAMNSLPIEDDGLVPLIELPSLRSLSLGTTGITDDSFTHLAECKSLEVLNVGNNDRLLGHVFAELLRRGKFSTLQNLDVSGTGIGHSGLDEINRLPQLVTLSAASAEVTDPVLDAIGSCTSLRTLNLRYNRLTNAGVQRLTRLRELEELDLGGCLAIGDDGLQFLRRHSQLQRLSLQGSGCTLAGATDLKEKFLENTTIVIANQEL